MTETLTPFRLAKRVSFFITKIGPEIKEIKVKDKKRV